MGTANKFAFGSCASKIGCDGAVPPSGQQNGSKPTALRMIEEGAERIARSLWTPVPSQVSHGGRAWVFRFARPGVISTAGWASSLDPDKDPSGEIETLTTFPRLSGSFLCEGTRAAPQRYMDQAGWVFSEAGASETPA